MKIDSHQVTFTTSHSHFQSTSLTDSYFSFQESLENNKLNNIDDIKLPSSRSLSSDFIISELTRAIMKNLIFLRKTLKNTATNVSLSVSEYEAIHFQAKATIKSGNKEIDVNINLSMQRSFTQNIGLNSLHVKGIFTDPLIISLDDDMPTLSEKTFHFDIDSDGKKEQISLLGKNAAFLALDKDKSGTINSAEELFGAKSGNGFEDLRLYDEDGNGWIDENDAIFHKLRIWKKNEDEDRLLALGEVGIGAIYLGNTDTPFSINSTNTNASLGLMRKSGFFLKEDGTSGIISQIDLAIQNNEKNTLKDALALFGDDQIQDVPRNGRNKSIFDILTEYIRQMEVELLGASGGKKETIEERLALLKKRLKSVQI